MMRREMDNDYWRDRYRELEETLGFTFAAFADALESSGDNSALVQRLAAVEKELADLRATRMVRIQDRLRGAVRRLRRIRRRLSRR
ncbi:hypothetical protein [Tessaracoccus lapidicaptus]|uniref:hypothetical protein n=1 Tax=Tessaracoccus lapidicaptus TaxID=1427523 RepID=UPI003340B69A